MNIIKTLLMSTSTVALSALLVSGAITSTTETAEASTLTATNCSPTLVKPSVSVFPPSSALSSVTLNQTWTGSISALRQTVNVRNLKVSNGNYLYTHNNPSTLEATITNPVQLLTATITYETLLNKKWVKQSCSATAQFGNNGSVTLVENHPSLVDGKIVMPAAFKPLRLASYQTGQIHFITQNFSVYRNFTASIYPIGNPEMAKTISSTAGRSATLSGLKSGTEYTVELVYTGTIKGITIASTPGVSKITVK